MKLKLIAIFSIFMGTTCIFSAPTKLLYIGVNLSSAEFGDVVGDGGTPFPGTYNTQYTYPLQAEVDYFQSNGMNTIRLPFRWERLQPTNSGPLDPTELTNLNSFVSPTTAKGMYVILDPHNFARYYPDQSTDGSLQSGNVGIIGGSSVSFADFRNFWGRLAGIYKTNDHIIFGLMNEPNAMPTPQWLQAANNAIVGIRSAGATNLILVPGNFFTGAWSWFSNFDSTANSQTMLGIIDPGSNYAYEVHQYFDTNSSGTGSDIASNTIGVVRLSDFTDWLKANNRKGFLGEFAVANSTGGSDINQIGGQTLTNTLRYIETNSDIWIGWTWWSAGPWWGSYPFSLEPQNLGQPNQTDAPAMPVVKSLIPLPIPLLTLTSSNQFQLRTRQGFIYQPQFSTNLSNEGWISNTPAFQGNGQATSVDMTVGSGPQGFYRVQITRAP